MSIREFLVDFQTKDYIIQTLQRQFLKYRMIRSLGDELLEDKTQETNPCMNEHEYRSTPRCG